MLHVVTAAGLEPLPTTRVQRARHTPRRDVARAAAADDGDYSPVVDIKLARLAVGQRVSSGSYGEVFCGLLDGDTEVVLKRPKGSGQTARRFFRAEAHACRRLRTTPGVAPFLGVAGADAFLVWRDVGLLTLEEVLKTRRPGPAAQEGLAQALGLPPSSPPSGAVKTLAKRLLTSLAAVHASGFVHRDCKPANVLLADDGRVLLLDCGAAADLVTRAFFDPDEAVFDPLFGPPEQFLDAGAPAPALAAAGGVLAVRLAGLLTSARGGAPAECFDSFSAGLVILLTAVPQLGFGPSDRLRQLKARLEGGSGGLAEWREGLPESVQRDFAILDADGGAGWDLVQRLAAAEPRGRPTCEAARAHRFLKGVR